MSTGAPWQDSPPSASGAWEISCAETDYQPARVEVFEQTGALWVDDPHAGRYPLDIYHWSLIDIHWRPVSDLSQQQQNQQTKHADTKTMKRKILLRHEATAIAAKNGLAGLYDLAQHQHMEKGIARGDEVIPTTGSSDPTTVAGFYFNPACGEGGIIMGTCGASEEEDGLEGVRYLFEAAEAAAAQATLLSELRGWHNQRLTAPPLPEA